MGAELKGLIIIPTHNEAKTIQGVIAEIRRYLPHMDIVVIDDSSDDTPRLAEEAGAEVVRLPYQLGYGAAVQTGFKYAVQRGYDFAVLMDGDGQHDPRFIEALLAPIFQGQADVVIGSRFLGEAGYQLPLIRRMGMALLRRIVSRATGQHITDPTSGFQALTREAMRFFAYDKYPADFPVGDTILMLKFARFRLEEVPVRMRGRLEGQSMFAGWRPFYYALKMLLAIFIVLLRQRTAR